MVGVDERAAAAVGEGNRWRCVTASHHQTSRPRIVGDGDEVSTDSVWSERAMKENCNITSRNRLRHARRVPIY